MTDLHDRTSAGEGFPEGAPAARLTSRRERRGRMWRLAFLTALMIGVLALGTLLITIINSAFGLVAIENEIPPAEAVQRIGLDPATDLASLPVEQLLPLLDTEISRNVGRRLERDQRFFADRLVYEDPALFDQLCASDEPVPACDLPPREQINVYGLVLERVVQPTVVGTWSLIDTVFGRADIEREVAAEFPNAELDFRSWVSRDFITSPQSPDPTIAGVRTAIFGSMWVVAITLLFSFPVGVGAAIYLEEYARDNRVNRMIQTNINNLAGVPSIIYGMLGLAIFVRTLEFLTSGSFLDGTADTTSNGRTVISAGLTLGLLILPIIIINSQEAIRAVPRSLRQAGMALGATQWQTTRSHVLPNAMSGILTGTILAMARALGETAPLVVVGASTFITTDPSGPFSKFTVLPIQIFQWTSRPQDEFRNIAAAAIIVLLVLLLALNATAVILRNRFARRNR